MKKNKRPTFDQLIQDLELVKQIAIEKGHITGAISAINSQAKLLGYDDGEKVDDSAQPVKIVIHRVDEKRYTDADIERQADGSFFIKPPTIKAS